MKIISSFLFAAIYWCCARTKKARVVVVEHISLLESWSPKCRLYYRRPCSSSLSWASNSRQESSITTTTTTRAYFAANLDTKSVAANTRRQKEARVSAWLDLSWNWAKIRGRALLCVQGVLHANDLQETLLSVARLTSGITVSFSKITA